jgi:hypothetical protein
LIFLHHASVKAFKETSPGVLSQQFIKSEKSVSLIKKLKQMNNFKTIGALLILAVSIVACDSNDFDNTPSLQAIGDVYVRVKKKW